MLKKLFKFGSNKEDVIQVWSRIEGLTSVEPVKEAHHFLPDWWLRASMWQNPEVLKKNKETNNNINNKGTIRRCPAVPEFMSMGFVVPLWTDVRIEIFGDGRWKWNTPSKDFSMSAHGDSQLKDLLPKNVQPETVVKADCPWYVKTPPGVSLLQLPMMWHFNPDFSVAPGVIWSDIHHEINQQMLFKKSGVFNLQRGTPLAHYIPIRREKFNLDVSEQTTDLRRQANASYYHVRSKFTGGYQHHQREVKKKELECPYHANKK